MGLALGKLSVIPCKLLVPDDVASQCCYVVATGEGECFQSCLFLTEGKRCEKEEEEEKEEMEGKKGLLGRGTGSRGEGSVLFIPVEPGLHEKILSHV